MQLFSQEKKKKMHSFPDQKLHVSDCKEKKKGGIEQNNLDEETISLINCHHQILGYLHF